MDKRIQKALNFIEQEYRTKILLRDLAAVAGLSVFHFQKLFKKETGESPADCLARIRLDQAAHLIGVNGELPFLKIALDCGFSSLSTFSRAFSQKFGMPPSQFRLRSLANQEQGGSLETFPAEVVYFPATDIFDTHTSVYNPKLWQAFESAEALYTTEHALPQDRTKYGVYAQLPFHAPRQQLNYYAGVQIPVQRASLSNNRIFRIPEGRYVRFFTDTPYEDLLALLIRFQVDWLNKMPYYINEIFAFELLLPENTPTDYPHFKRYIYLPVKRK